MRSKLAGKAGLIVVPPFLPVVGAIPLIFFTAYVPCTSQPYSFLPAFGVHGGVPVQPEFVQAAEWNFWAIQSPTEYIQIAAGFCSTGSTPSFSSSLLPLLDTHGPGVVTPIAASQNVRVPDPDWGRNGWIVAFLPPTWDQLVSVQV